MVALKFSPLVLSVVGYYLRPFFSIRCDPDLMFCTSIFLLGCNSFTRMYLLEIALFVSSVNVLCDMRMTCREKNQLFIF